VVLDVYVVGRAWMGRRVMQPTLYLRIQYTQRYTLKHLKYTPRYTRIYAHT
jgi:hypothetical protein